MRDIETIIRGLKLPDHFKKHPPHCLFTGTKFEYWQSSDLYGLIMARINYDELEALHGAVVAKNYIGYGAFDPGSPEENTLSDMVNAVWRDVSALEDRTLAEKRMKPARVFALQNEAKTVGEFWKVLHDLEQGARNMQKGWRKRENKLKAALEAAQLALADALQKQ